MLPQPNSMLERKVRKEEQESARRIARLRAKEDQRPRDRILMQNTRARAREAVERRIQHAVSRYTSPATSINKVIAQNSIITSPTIPTAVGVLINEEQTFTATVVVESVVIDVEYMNVSLTVDIY